MKKETAIEWYANQLKKIGLTSELIGHLTEEAKVIEKEQRIEDYSIGYSDGQVDSNKTAKQYLKETLKSK
jgi:hypothetical protein